MEQIQLGWEVQDRVTSLKGIVVGIHHWLTGCDTATVKPQGLDDKMKDFEGQGFDVSRLLVIERWDISKWVDQQGDPHSVDIAEATRKDTFTTDPTKNGGPQDHPVEGAHRG